jgi:hypothetical protein
MLEDHLHVKIRHDHHHLNREYYKNKLLTTTKFTETKEKYYVFCPHSKLSSRNHRDEIQVNRGKRSSVGFMIT